MIILWSSGRSEWYQISQSIQIDVDNVTLLSRSNCRMIICRTRRGSNVFLPQISKNQSKDMKNDDSCKKKITRILLVEPFENFSSCVEKFATWSSMDYLMRWRKKKYCLCRRRSCRFSKEGTFAMNQGALSRFQVDRRFWIKGYNMSDIV